MNRLADFLAHHSAVVRLFVVLLTAGLCYGLSKLGIDETPRNFLHADHKHSALLEEIFSDFGSDDNDCIVVVEAADVFAPEAVVAIRELVRRARQINGVSSVYSLDDIVVMPTGGRLHKLWPDPRADAAAIGQRKSEARAHPLAGQLVSDDFKTTIVIVRLHSDLGAVSELTKPINELRNLCAGARDLVRVRLTGIPVIRTEMFALIGQETLKFNILGAVVGILIAYVLFRRPAAIFIVIASAMLGTIWILGAMGLAGEPINLINAVMPTLVLVIGFTDSVHLMFAVRRSRAQDADPQLAADRAVRELGSACALTSLTTAVGFGSLTLAGLPIIQRFGLVCAAGTVLVFVAVITTVPLLVRSRLGNHVGRAGQSLAAAALRPKALALIGTVQRHATMIAVAGIGITIAMLVGASRLRVDSQLTEAIPDRNDSARAIAHCDQALGGAMISYVLIEWDPSNERLPQSVLSAMGDVHALIERQPLINGPLSAVSLLQSGPPAMAAGAAFLDVLPAGVVRRFINFSKRRALVTFRLMDEGTATYAPIFEALETELQQLQMSYPDLQLSLSGPAVLATKTINTMIADLAKSLMLAAVIIFAVMACALRSVRLGLIAVLPNIFPLAVTAGALAATGRDLQLTSVTVFTVCLGLAVDDTIHFLTRFKRQLATGCNVQSAISVSFQEVGAAILTTTLILGSAFATLLISEMPVIRLFGGLAVTALAAALVGDLVILPALLVCFAKPTGSVSRIS